MEYFAATRASSCCNEKDGSNPAVSELLELGFTKSPLNFFNDFCVCSYNWSRLLYYMPVSTGERSSIVSFACFKSLNANISDGNCICFCKILLYFWSKVEIKLLIDWDCSLQYSSKSLHFSQLSEIHFFCNIRSRKSNY